MSRNAIIKRAKIRRGRRLSAFDWLRRAWHKKIMEMLLDPRPIAHKISVQPVSEMTEEQRAARCAPRIEVTICRSNLP